MREIMNVLGAQIQAIEFDHPFTLAHTGAIEWKLSHPDGVHAPSVHNDPDGDVTIDGDGWEALTGMTGQESYSGAVMHPSEFIGAGIAEKLADLAEDEPQTFAVVAVSDPDPDESDAGWAILRRTV